MFRSIAKVVLRKIIYRAFIGRSKTILLPILLVSWCGLVWFTSWWLVTVVSKALFLPYPLSYHLEYFRRNNSLAHYMEDIQVLIEPSSACPLLEEVPLIIMVASSPDNMDKRMAVRETWAKHQPTYFVLGLRGNSVDEQLVDSYIEAKQYSDIIVFDFTDTYENLTLKTALMIHWTLVRCPQAQFMLKTDDDVLVNPWILENVIKDHADEKLVGYVRNNTLVNRDVYSKWYVPRWMLYEDILPKYLAGSAYIISGEYLEKILKAAYRVPLVYLEDVYFTYLVAHKKLRLPLKHDRRLNPFQPMLSIGCVYANLATVHGFNPQQMLSAYAQVKSISSSNYSCTFINYYLDKDMFMYYLKTS